MRDKKAEQCILDDIVYIQEEYQIDIEDPTSMPTPSEIKIESKRVKQKINGYLQIHKDTHLSVKDS